MIFVKPFPVIFGVFTSPDQPVAWFVTTSPAAMYPVAIADAVAVGPLPLVSHPFSCNVFLSVLSDMFHPREAKNFAQSRTVEVPVGAVYRE